MGCTSMDSQTIQLIRYLQAGPRAHAGLEPILELLAAVRQTLSATGQHHLLSDLVDLLEDWADDCDENLNAAQVLCQAADIAEILLNDPDRAGDLSIKATLRKADGRPISAAPPPDPALSEDPGDPTIHFKIQEREDLRDGVASAMAQAVFSASKRESVKPREQVPTSEAAPSPELSAAAPPIQLSSAQGAPAAPDNPDPGPNTSRPAAPADAFASTPPSASSLQPIETTPRHQAPEQRLAVAAVAEKHAQRFGISALRTMRRYAIAAFAFTATAGIVTGVLLYAKTQRGPGSSDENMEQAGLEQTTNPEALSAQPAQPNEKPGQRPVAEPHVASQNADPAAEAEAGRAERAQARSALPEQPRQPNIARRLGPSAASPNVRAARERARFFGGDLNRDRVAATIDAGLAELQQCYAKALERRPRLQGFLVLAWHVRMDGRPKTPERVAGSIKDRPLAHCSATVIGKMRFPKPRRAPAKVRYPFVFRRPTAPQAAGLAQR